MLIYKHNYLEKDVIHSGYRKHKMLLKISKIKNSKGIPKSFRIQYFINNKRNFKFKLKKEWKNIFQLIKLIIEK